MRHAKGTRAEPGDAAGDLPERSGVLAEDAAERQALVTAAREAAAPVVDDLRRTGFQVERIDDLYRKKLKYPEAIPVLLKWLPIVRNRNAKVQIVWALGVKWAKPIAAAPLVEAFREDPTSRWEIADALCRVADESVVGDIISLVMDPDSGTARQMLTLCLGEIDDPRSIAALSELLGDDAVSGHAVMAAGKLRAASLRPQIEPFLSDGRAWVRSEARKALARIEGSERSRSR